MPSLADTLETKRKMAGRFLAKYLRARSTGKLSRLLRGRILKIRDAIAAAAVQVHAVGVGKKIVAGKPVAEWCIRLYVLEKLPLSLLGKFALPSTIAGIPTDIIESPPAFLMPADPDTCSLNRQTLIRPIVPGISVGHFGVTAGTLACFCRSVKTGDDPEGVYILSNTHVLAPTGVAVPGDDVLQPALKDGGTTGGRVATLTRSLELLSSDGERNAADAAIAKLDDGIEWNPAICTIGRLQGAMDPARDQRVRMHGRTTAGSIGVIEDIENDPVVGLNPAHREVVARFEDQIRIVPAEPSRSFGQGGDSGALIVDEATPKAVGLYFAGPENGSYGLAAPIRRVMAKLEIELL